jgi:hypothetical protein
MAVVLMNCVILHYWNSPDETARVYVDRIAGGHCHHCDFSGVIAAGLEQGKSQSPND